MYYIDTPIIILSAPRAGSTLLFETLARHPNIYTIGGESHALIEHIPQLSTVARGYVSNRLDTADATDEIAHELRMRFIKNARNFKGQPLNKDAVSFRLLEKTPKNALRVNFLNKVFKDAKFIYLVRDPRENISSIMQAWRSQKFVTYPKLPDFNGGWSLLLPDNWRSQQGKSLASIATYQYTCANNSIIESLAAIEQERKFLINYSDFIENPETTIRSVLDFANLNNQAIGEMLKNGLPYSRYTLTKPEPNKWHQNAQDIAPYIHNTNEVLKQINTLLLAHQQAPFSNEIDTEDVKSRNGLCDNMTYPRVARNSTCPCGSGKRYRQCHGKLA